MMSLLFVSTLVGTNIRLPFIYMCCLTSTFFFVYRRWVTAWCCSTPFNPSARIATLVSYHHCCHIIHFYFYRRWVTAWCCSTPFNLSARIATWCWCTCCHIIVFSSSLTGCEHGVVALSSNSFVGKGRKVATFYLQPQFQPRFSS